MSLQLNKSPASLRGDHNGGASIHFIGIGGLAMAGLALELRRLGYRITGSDEFIYGYAKTMLEEADFTASIPCAAENLPGHADLVIVGTTHLWDNLEFKAARDRGWPCLTFPEFFAKWFPPSCHCVLIAGTNGKTTTTAMLVHLLDEAGLNFSWLIGGIHGHPPRTLHLTNAPYAIIEADESRSARWLPTPKLNILPCTSLIITNLAPDHPETFATEEDFFDAFRLRIAQLPENGFLIAHARDLEQLGNPPTAAQTIIVGNSDNHSGLQHTYLPDENAFTLNHHTIPLSSHGTHHAENAALATLAATRILGKKSPSEWHPSLKSFRGVSGRMQTITTSPLPIIIDQKCHPVAIKANLQSLRQRWPKRRWHLIMRPRSLSERNWYIDRELPAALAHADIVHLFPEQTMRDDPPVDEDKFKSISIVNDLQSNGTEAHYHRNLSGLMDCIASVIQPQDGFYVALSIANATVWEQLRDQIPTLLNQTKPQSS